MKQNKTFNLLAAAPSFKNHPQPLLKSYLRVREHSLFGFRWSALVDVLPSNEYCFT
jgi:hypothetical protein